MLVNRLWRVFRLRTFPLRVLDRTLGELHETQRSLAVQMGRLDVALNNMSQGLVMFDSSARLVVVNQRYLDMFGLSPETVKPGLHHSGGPRSTRRDRRL